MNNQLKIKGTVEATTGYNGFTPSDYAEELYRDAKVNSQRKQRLQRRLDNLEKEQQQNLKHQMKQRIFKAGIEYYEARAEYCYYLAESAYERELKIWTTLCWTSWLNWTDKQKIRQNRLCRIQNTGNQRKIKMDNQLNANNMSKEMDWDNFVPTREIREYDMKFRESIRQREHLKVELAELEKRKRDIFWDVEYAILSTGIKYFNTCAEY